MILPNVRAGFGRAEAEGIIELLTRYEERPREYAERRLCEEGMDTVLDDPRTLNAVLTTSNPAAASAPVTFYVLVRHALLESGIDDRVLADYLAALVMGFGQGDRAHAIDADGVGDRRMLYLIDIVLALESATGRRAFLLRAHLGDFALWSSGLFPDRVAARVRRGAPGLRYYEELGSSGYRMAATSTDASSHGLDEVFDRCSRLFPELRVALNRISDRYFFPQASDPVERLLRQVVDRVGGGSPE